MSLTSTAPSTASPQLDISSLLTSWGLPTTEGEPAALEGMLGGVLDAVRDYAVLRKPRPAKDFTVPATIPITPEQVTSKDFWGSLGSIVTTVAPFIFQLASGTDSSGKEYQPATKEQAQQQIAGLLAPHANDKDFMTVLGATMPQILDLLSQVLGGKNYMPPEKSFFSDIGDALSKVNLSDVISTGVKIASTVAPFFL